MTLTLTLTVETCLRARVVGTVWTVKFTTVSEGRRFKSLLLFTRRMQRQLLYVAPQSCTSLEMRSENGYCSAAPTVDLAS